MKKIYSRKRYERRRGRKKKNPSARPRVVTYPRWEKHSPRCPDVPRRKKKIPSLTPLLPCTCKTYTPWNKMWNSKPFSFFSLFTSIWKDLHQNLWDFLRKEKSFISPLKKKICLQASVCTFQPGPFWGCGSEGVKPGTWPTSPTAENSAFLISAFSNDFSSLLSLLSLNINWTEHELNMNCKVDVH